ncbi:hypothetical protein BS47DRAFT_1372753 [Hydnum rufescens UP504]|uniref:2-nitropropane dioxygenase n=1 Tax=Hydnum rufescens UP504 TaxID=1448309 RepID=A0A9P6DVH5_9AGAM|nr:hypothetical protein BS47DRAFT_1372753 [Hydnum rufescens UP504]
MIVTAITEMFGIRHPIIQAGMNVAAGPELAAAVTNAGGLGVIGGVRATPRILELQIRTLKENLSDPSAPFGVDLLFPQIGGDARKTNYDYTKGQTSQLIDGSRFVCAVGVPPKEVVSRLHEANIPIMNHVPKALAAGVDLICAQGGEGGGHTGEIPFSILIPACLDAIKGARSPLTGKPVHLVAAGGIYDGRGLAAALAYGAQAVWVGTRFVACVEAGAPKLHKDLVLKSGYEDNVRTSAYTGRPMRVFKTAYIADWENNRQEEAKSLMSQGIIPVDQDVEIHPGNSMAARRWLMGRASAVVNDIKTAREIVDDMMSEAETRIKLSGELIVPSRL